MKTKLIQTKDYLLLIDEEAEIKYNAIIFESDICLINVVGKGYVHNKTDFKIIAYYPLNSKAKELDLPLLPNPFEEIDVEKLSEKANGYAYYGKPLGEKYLAFKEGFIEGYKAAQSNKQFSLEDIQKAFESGYKSAKNYSYKSNGTYQEDFEKFIQSLSTQQLPKEFIPKYEDYEIVGERDGDGYPLWSKRLKTITNSEGKKELVGEYKY